MIKPAVSSDIEARMRQIRFLAMDVDGVLTEGTLFYSENKQEMGCFNIKDGMGITLARSAGLKVAIISGRQSEVVARRAADLKVGDVYLGVLKKKEVFSKLIETYGLSKEQACYIGDDINDLPVFEEAGLAVAVADAVAEVKQAAHYVTASSGGRGAVREIIDGILYAQGLYHQAIKIFR